MREAFFIHTCHIIIHTCHIIIHTCHIIIHNLSIRAEFGARGIRAEECSGLGLGLGLESRISRFAVSVCFVVYSEAIKLGMGASASWEPAATGISSWG